MPTTRDVRWLLRIPHPIIQAPMAGSTTPELVAAVSDAGGLGSLGAWHMTPEQITAAIADIRALTDRPFNINLFAGGWEDDRAVDPKGMLNILSSYHAELGLAAPEVPGSAEIPFEAQMDAIIDAAPPVFSFTFGMPGQDAIARLKERGVTIIGTATTVAEAQVLVRNGCDAVVAQGIEAGGHRGTFTVPIDDVTIGTMALVPQVVDAIDVPVIAAGGIMDGRGIVAALALGASAAQMGTAFLVCDEASVPAVHRAALRKARGEDTTITRAFSGRQARGIINEFVETWEGRDDDILPFPLQNAATKPLRDAAGDRDDSRFLSMWAGQGAALARAPLPAAELMHQLIREVKDVHAGLAAAI